MDNLVSVLQEIIEKYNVSEQDIATIQEALGVLESGGEDEFTYEEPVEEEV